MPPQTLVTGRVARIERGVTHDGPGLRTVVFLKGCPLRCIWCHSPETQSLEPEILLYKERCIACGECIERCPERAAGWDGEPTVDRSRCVACGTCLDVCSSSARALVGTLMTVDEVVQEVVVDRALYSASGGGLTISGGEPILQPIFLLALLATCRRERIHTVVETCGLGNWAILERVAALANLIYFDIKLFDAARHREATGHDNAGILANVRRLIGLRAGVRIRIPLVPGVNDDEENVAAIGAFVCDLGLKHVEVIPFHREGIAQYHRLGRTCPLQGTFPPSPELVKDTVTRLRQFGLSATVGGL